VNDLAVVHVLQGGSQPNDKTVGRLGFQRPRLQPRLERGPGHKLHREIINAKRGFLGEYEIVR